MSVGEVVAQRYELVEQIGRGGQAIVYRALDRKTGSAVALKMLSSGRQNDPNAVERMAREQQAMVKLAGTSAVGFIDLCTAESGDVCLIMELLQGETLEEKLDALERRGERMSIDEMLDVMRPIVVTLDKAHCVGIVHRDLKPGNIFLTEPSGSPRLLDFGLSRLQSSVQLTALGQVLGSPSYIAPEMWTGQSENVDYRADIYSLGVILFRILAGRLPFEGNDLRQKFVETTTSERPSLQALRPDLSPHVDAWVRRVLAIDRDKRFDSARMAFEAMRQAVGVPVEQQAEDPQTASMVDSVREWLSTPVSNLPNSLTSACGKAAGMLDKLKRSIVARVEDVPPPPPAVALPSGSRMDETSILDLADVIDDGPDERASKAGGVRLPPRPRPPTMLVIKASKDSSQQLSTQASARPLPPKPRPPTLLCINVPSQDEPQTVEPLASEATSEDEKTEARIKEDKKVSPNAKAAKGPSKQASKKKGAAKKKKPKKKAAPKKR
jgi:serine/threonine-protein kinase